MTEPPRNGEYDDWLDSVEDGKAYYVRCDEGHGCPEFRCALVSLHGPSSDARRALTFE